MRTRPTTGVSPDPLPCVAVTSERSFARLNERVVMLGGAPHGVKRTSGDGARQGRSRNASAVIR